MQLTQDWFNFKLATAQSLVPKSFFEKQNLNSFSFASNEL